VLLLYYLITVRDEFVPLLWHLVFWGNSVAVTAVASHLLVNWRHLTPRERGRVFLFVLFA
jgi:hypothetical protein